jgi:hypothetical protein
MSSHVSVNTYTHSVTHVTGEMIRSLKDIIRWSGLSLDKILDDWSSVERAVHTWLGSKHLKKVTLEVYNPNTNSLVVRWDIDVDYSYDPGDNGSLWADHDAIRHAILKAGVVPSSCKYEFKLLAPGGAKVLGWGPSPYRSTVGFTQHSLGTTIGAGSLASSTSYWRKAS